MPGPKTPVRLSHTSGSLVARLALMFSTPPPAVKALISRIAVPRHMMRPWMVSVMTTAVKPPKEV